MGNALFLPDSLSVRQTSIHKYKIIENAVGRAKEIKSGYHAIIIPALGDKPAA